MIEIAAAVEHDLLDAGLERPLGDELAHGLGRGEVAALGERAFEVLVQRRSRRHGLAGGIVDHLRINMLGGAEHRQAHPTIRRTLQRMADPARTPKEALI